METGNYFSQIIVSGLFIYYINYDRKLKRKVISEKPLQVEEAFELLHVTDKEALYTASR